VHVYGPPMFIHPEEIKYSNHHTLRHQILCRILEIEDCMWCRIPPPAETLTVVDGRVITRVSCSGHAGGRTAASGEVGKGRQVPVAEGFQVSEVVVPLSSSPADGAPAAEVRLLPPRTEASVPDRVGPGVHALVGDWPCDDVLQITGSIRCTTPRVPQHSTVPARDPKLEEASQPMVARCNVPLCLPVASPAA
jgi:hypothetical protein